MVPGELSHYEILGVVPMATTAEIRRAYVALARRHHPDAGGSDDRMRAINAAYAVLADRGRRAAYDRTLLVYRPGPIGGSDTDEPAEPDEPTEWDEWGEWDDGDVPVARSHRVLTITPVVVFALSIAIGSVGLAIDVPAVIAVAFVVFFVSGGLMVLAPLIVMGRSRRR